MGYFPACSGVRWGCSSNGRAPALHAGGTGIDTLLLHTFFLYFLVGPRLAAGPSLPVGLQSVGVGALAQW